MKKWLGRTGSGFLHRWLFVRYITAIVATVVAKSLRPSSWPLTTRNVLARQVLFTGFDALRFVGFVAIMIGLAVVVQAQLWLNKVGQSELLGPILVAVVVRELAPLLTNVIVIARSGTAISTELGNMNVSGEVHVLDSLGLDPFMYLLMPRVLGVAISVFCLTVFFIFMAFLSGYLAGMLLSISSGQPSVFFGSVLNALQPADVVNLLVKTLVPGLLTGAICANEGFGVHVSITEVPQATTRAVVRSITTLFIVSGITSALTYI